MEHTCQQSETKHRKCEEAKSTPCYMEIKDTGKMNQKTRMGSLVGVNLLASEVARTGFLEEMTRRRSGPEPCRQLGGRVPGRESSPKEAAEAEARLASSLIISLSNRSGVSDRDSRR